MTILTRARLPMNNMFLRILTFLRPSKATLSVLSRRFKSASLRFKIAFFVVVLLTCTSFVLCIMTVRIMNSYIMEEIVKRGESVGKSIAASAGYNLLSRDVLALDNTVFKAKSSTTDMAYAVILDSTMRTLAHSEAPMIGEKMSISEGRLYRTSMDGVTVRELQNPGVFEIVCPVVFMNKKLGTVVIGMKRTVLEQAQRKVTNRILIVFGIILVLGIFASSLLASFLIKPIKELSAGVAELKKGVAKSPLRVYSHDELGSLTQNFNEMSARIAEQQDMLSSYARDLEESYVSIVKVVAAAIDARDSYTHGHSARVSQFSLLLGKEIGLDQQQLDDLEIACLFHDVGKIKTPDSILLKKDKLTPDEYQEMMRHVEYGASILSRAPSLAKYIPSTMHHHERHDGKGYPAGLLGKDIPLFAAIISIADAFDAMTSDRPYRKALPEEKALREIGRTAGTQFRPDLAEIFLKLMTGTGVTQSHLSVAESV